MCVHVISCGHRKDFMGESWEDSPDRLILGMAGVGGNRELAGKDDWNAEHSK